MQLPRKLIIIILVIIVLFSMQLSIKAEPNYNLNYDDTSGDVKTLSDDEPEIVPGHENIDLVKLQSYKTTVQQNIILELTVSGKIVDSESNNYNIMVFDGETESYMITYSNGTCTGFSMNSPDFEGDELEASIENGATLQITLPIRSLGYISEFNIMATTFEYQITEDTFEIYFDEIPDGSTPWDGYPDGDGWSDKPIFITEPKDGATVFNTCSIEGISNTDDYEIERVEIQIDSKSSGGWQSATTSDDWSTWSLDWDTSDMTEGEHRIYGRAYDGVEYHYDSIKVYLDQLADESPPTLEVPTFSVGDRFEYVVFFNYEDMDMPEGSTYTGKMTIEITGIETLTLNGNDYEVYVFEIDSIMEMKSGLYSMSNTMEGTAWVRTSDLADVKEDITYESTESGFGLDDTYSYHEIYIYDPPNDKYQFPMSVAEKWIAASTAEVECTDSYNGETDSYSYTETSTMEFECLRKDTVTVPAGSFDVFAVYYVQSYSDDDWTYEDDGTDTDDDGWTDWEENEYGTDPDDPTDYPPSGDGGNGGNGGSGTSDDSDDGWVVEEDILYYEDEYNVDYFSPEIGFLVKMESYNSDRQLTSSFELISYKYGDKEYNPDGNPEDHSYDVSGGFKVTVLFLIILIIVVVIIILVFLLVRKRRKTKVQETQPGISGQTQPLPLEPVQPVPGAEPVVRVIQQPVMTQPTGNVTTPRQPPQ
ncbi:MAG: hypothetical protein JSV49_05030 [Thermoplasmata archaeon]|nr:MAG: hypothetical protein JSV49_05030 [Thermoplasmata archaeon]